MQINRLFEIIYLLLDRRQITASELAEHFEVSSRTIYRDIETLSQAGIPVYAMKGKGGGIRLTENFILNKSVLTEEERKKILQSLHGMNAVHMEETEPVLSKLSALFGGEREDWIEIEFSSWNADDYISRRFRLFKEAIFSRTIVEFAYSGANGISSIRRVEPVKLVFRANSWYLYAWCLEKKAFRFFKLARMDNEVITDTHFAGRRLQETWKEPENGKNIYEDKLVHVTALISAGKAYRILEEIDRKSVQRLEDGSYKVTFVMPEDDWLYQYLMTYGADIKVLEPERIRNKLTEELRKALNNYICTDTL